MVGIAVKRVIGPRGQVVIPKDVREQLGLREGSTVVFEVEGGRLVLRPEADPEGFVEQFCAAFPRKLRRKIDLKALVEEQLEERHALRGR